MSAKAILIGIVMLCVLLLGYVLHGTHLLSHFARASGSSEALMDTVIPDEYTQQIGVVRDRRIRETSGIDASLQNENTYWVHNDSANPPSIFLISASGKVLVQVDLKGAVNRDWEDLCVCELNGKPVVIVGDVGDNAGQWDKYHLYVFPEPKLAAEVLAEEQETAKIEITNFAKLEFTYEDGPRNCEAIAFDSSSKKLFLFQKAIDREEKEKSFGAYVLEFEVDSESDSKPGSAKSTKLKSNVAQRVGEIKDRLVTGAAFSRDGQQLILCNYVTCTHLKLAENSRWPDHITEGRRRTYVLPIQRQREAICFEPDGQSVIAASENYGQPLWKFELGKLNRDKK